MSDLPDWDRSGPPRVVVEARDAVPVHDQQAPAPPGSPPDIRSLSYALRHAIGVASSHDPHNVPPALYNLHRAVERARQKDENAYVVLALVDRSVVTRE